MNYRQKILHPSDENRLLLPTDVSITSLSRTGTTFGDNDGDFRLQQR